MKNKNMTDGIEINFGKGRSLKVLSYAIRVNGGYQVSHENTRANRLAGCDLKNLLAIEQQRNPALKVL